MGINSDTAAAHLTHELKAPLTAIIAALHLLSEGEEAVGGRRLADVALTNAHRLRQLIDDIMDASKIKAGCLRLEVRPHDPGLVAQDVVRTLRPWAVREDISLRVSVQRGCPPVLADAERFGQALTNLISNALKFTPTGGSVEVSVRPGEGPFRETVLVSVRDTGDGIPHEEQERIFGYFQRGDGEAERTAGTGLGLPLARSMIELMRGSIWVESAPGEGATFRFTLPAAA